MRYIKNQTSNAPYRVVLLLSFMVLLFSCKQREKIAGIDPAFSQYVEGYTSGVISKTSAIRVRLTSVSSTTHSLNEALKDPLFSFTPSVKGKAYWTDARTIEFQPDEYLTPGQLYTVNFKLGKATEVPAAFSNFIFNVQAVNTGIQITQTGLKAEGNSKEKMILYGTLETADLETPELVEKTLTVQYLNQSLPVRWEHNEKAKIHHFTVEGIRRDKSASFLNLEWNGSPLHSNESGHQEIEIPALGDFTVLNIQAVQEAENYVLIQFSEAVATSQNLDGLITVSDNSNLSYSINGSEVKLYVPENFDGNYTVTAYEGIRNLWGNKLPKTYTGNLFFENRLPSVSIQGKGIILPNSGNLVLPFETINLSAVDVSIIKIYENNIPQFLQSNSYEGDYDLRRVASPVVKQTIRLDNDKTLDLHRKQKFSLDIDKYLKTEPGAIYHVTIGFRPEYSLYNCPAPANKDDDDEYASWYTYGSGEGELDSDAAFWDAYNTYYPYGYSWRDRNNPCSPSYYNKEKWASRNILASNIGLTAKRANDNSMLVVVTDILNAQPLSNVDLELLDYQQQSLFKTRSDANGLASFHLKKRPYLLIATRGTEKGYLKLDDGNSLLLSRFDVSGVEVKSGLKGFIFGERGVWRPGDTMYINFILEDKRGDLPKDHPVEFNLITPQGQLYKRMIETKGENGFYLFTTSTDAASPTGNWTARIKVGGASFEKRLKVETIMPNRLKIELDFGQKAEDEFPDLSKGTLKSNWLFGAPANNLEAKIDASLYARKTAFKKFPGYHFDNPTSNYQEETKTIFSGRLNEEGVASFQPNFGSIKNAPGMLSASLLVKVFEPGGAFSIDNTVVPYSPYKSYAGIQMPEGEKPWGYLATDKTFSLPIVNVDAKGNLLNGAQKMEVMLYRISWRWWWDGKDDFSNFTQNTYNKLLKKDTVQLTNGKGEWKLSAPGKEWGRYLILVKDLQSGHQTGQPVYFDDPWWQTRNNMGDPSAAAMLSFTSNKEKYNVDENITLQIPGSKGGRAFISIESGSRIIKTDWVDMQEGQTQYTFKAEAGMAPNIYVNVSLIQPHAQTVNDLPIRMYGVIPILIEDNNTVIKPVIQLPDVIRPEQSTSITVSEANGKAMTYSIAIVDEGLLDLTHFKTPNPHDALYAREALGVKSWDLFDNVIGAWGTRLERILTIGGDEVAAGAGKGNRANRFKPIVKYMGPYQLKKGQKQTHAFQLPPYIGSVRAMVVASGAGAYGAAEKTCTVKNPLMILGTMPRVLAPAETVRIPVSVFALENNIRNVSVSLQNNELLEIEGSSTQQVSFQTPGEKMIFFNAKVKEKTGVAKVKISATGASEKAHYELELQVRNPNPVITNVSSFTLDAGQSWNETVKPFGISENSKATLEISSIPPINLEKRLDYLIQYPHGCIEQITSAAFPQLVLSQLTTLSDRRKAETERNIRSVIERTRSFQLPDGGFSYWPGLTESDEWGTNYAGHFLLKAKEQGYIVPAELIQQWIIFQRRKANQWAPSTQNFYGGDLMQAYRLYLLAYAKAPELGAMNRLKEFKYLSPEAKWRLSAAYQLVGQGEVASSLIQGVPTTFKTPQDPGLTYGSELRDEAMVLEALTLMNRRKEATEVLKSVSAKLASERWYSTQTTAYSLIAIAAYCGTNESKEKATASGSVNGKNIQINTTAAITQLPVSTTDKNKSISITNNGNNTLFVRLITQGQPVSGEEVQIQNNRDVLTMAVDYLNLNGTLLKPDLIPQGTDFVARVKIYNPGIRGRYRNMTLSQIFPAGWEILNTRMLDNEGSFHSSQFSYQDIRDDRVYTHFDIREGETLTYYVMLNAAYTGNYFLPGVYCDAMYDNTIGAGVKGQWVEVK